MTRLADRQIEIVLRDRVRFGVGAIARLPELVAAAGGSRVFVVTDPGVARIGVVDRALGVLDRARASSTRLRRGRAEPGAPRPSSAGRRRCGPSGSMGRSSCRSAAARRWTPPRRSPSAPRTSRSRCWELDYDGAALAPGRPGRRRPDDRRDRRRDEHLRRHHRRGRSGARTTSAIRRCCRVATILDPALTVGLPPAATAATGVDAMTHSLESLLSANPNPFAEAIALGVIRTVAEWLPRAVADGTDLEARSQMLMASHLAGVGRRAARASGLVHALGPRARDARPAAARDGAGRRPARGPRLLPRRSATASWRWSASRSGPPRRPRTRRRPPAPRSARSAGLRRASASDRRCAPRLRRARARRRRPGRHRRRGDPQLAAPADASPRRARSWRPCWADRPLVDLLRCRSISGCDDAGWPYSSSASPRVRLRPSDRIHRSTAVTPGSASPSSGPASSGSARSRPAERVDGWLADLDGLLDAMDARHPDLFHDTPRAEIERAIDELKVRTATATDDELMVGVAQIVALVSAGGRDAHTGLFPWSPDSGYPVHSLRSGCGCFRTGSTSWTRSRPTRT